jgi:hypothetical protein
VPCRLQGSSESSLPLESFKTEAALESVPSIFSYTTAQHSTFNIQHFSRFMITLSNHRIHTVIVWIKALTELLLAICVSAACSRSHSKYDRAARAQPNSLSDFLTLRPRPHPTLPCRLFTSKIPPSPPPLVIRLTGRDCADQSDAGPSPSRARGFAWDLSHFTFIRRSRLRPGINR